jgi:hypothetical protein
MSCLVREKTAGPGEKNLISQPNRPQEPYKDNQVCITKENPLLAECLLVYPVFDECDVTRHPFHFAMMRHYQQRSGVTKQLLLNQPEQYALVTLGDTDLICYIANPQQPKIVLTDDMLPRIVRYYYHLTAQHAEGKDRLEWSLKRHFYHLHLRDKVHSQVSRCQRGGWKGHPPIWLKTCMGIWLDPPMGCEILWHPSLCSSGWPVLYCLEEAFQG